MTTTKMTESWYESRAKELTAASLRSAILNFSSLFDEYTIRQRWFLLHAKREVWVSTIYKRVKDKIKPVDPDVTDGSRPGELQHWRERALAQEAKLTPDPERLYKNWPRYRDPANHIGITSRYLDGRLYAMQLFCVLAGSLWILSKVVKSRP